MTEIIAENLQMGPRAAGAGGGSYEPMGGRRSTPTAPAPSASVSSEESEIPIIDENEPLNAGVEEDEMAIKEKDLPF